MAVTNTLKKAKDFFYEGNYSRALELFTQEKDNYSAGLCSLILKQEKQALSFWKKDEKNCPGCAFGLSVLKLIHLNKTKLPTFFQTRAFLEVYLNLFLKNDLLEWAENLISSCDDLFKCNPESYKFIGRALFANGYFNLAITFCQKSLDFFYYDPEAFLILSQCYFLLKDYDEALRKINLTIRMVDNYYPAIVFKKVIEDEINKTQT